MTRNNSNNNIETYALCSKKEKKSIERKFGNITNNKSITTKPTYNLSKSKRKVLPTYQQTTAVIAFKLKSKVNICNIPINQKLKYYCILYLHNTVMLMEKACICIYVCKYFARQ